MVQRPLVSAALLVAVIASLGGCSDGGGSVDREAGSSPPRSVRGAPSTSAATAAAGKFAGAGALRNADGTTTKHGVTYAAFARYSGRVAIAQSGGFLAVAVGGNDGLELRISKDGERPRVAKGAGLIPTWAEIHVTPDDHGIPVVSYPRCSGNTADTCDLYVWSSLDHREEKLKGLSEPGRAEIDGAQQWSGAAVGFVLAHGRATMGQLSSGDVKRKGRLVVTQTGAGKATTVSTGETKEVAIGDDRIAELQGPCGERRRLLDLTGRETFRQGSACGFNEGIDGVGAAIEDGHFHVADRKANGGMTVYDHPLDGDRTAITHATLSEDYDIVDWAAVGATSGYALIGYSCAGDGTEAKDACLVVKVTGLRPR